MCTDQHSQFVSFFPSLHMPILHAYFLHDYCQGCNTLHCSSHTLLPYSIVLRSSTTHLVSLLGLLFLPMSQTIRPHWPDWCTIPSSSASLVPFYHTTLRYTSSKNTLQANHAGNNVHCVFCSLFLIHVSKHSSVVLCYCCIFVNLRACIALNICSILRVSQWFNLFPILLNSSVITYFYSACMYIDLAWQSCLILPLQRLRWVRHRWRCPRHMRHQSAGL